MNNLRSYLLVFLVFVVPAGPLFAWIYPEHRDIAILAEETLDTEHQAIFDQLWQDARLDYEER